MQLAVLQVIAASPQLECRVSAPQCCSRVMLASLPQRLPNLPSEAGKHEDMAGEWRFCAVSTRIRTCFYTSDNMHVECPSIKA